MNNILIVDTETTGTNESAICIEVAAILYSVPFAATLRSFSSLLPAKENPAESVNHIPATLLPLAPEREYVWSQVRDLASQADAIVAHNAEFDSKYVPISDPQWICSMTDLAWPCQQKPGESLTKLALAHGLGISHAHRALVDCDLLARLFTRVHEMGTDLQGFLARGMRPKARYVVAERGFDPKRNELSKSHGFAWDSTRKEWHRTMAREDATQLPFSVRECP